MSATAKLFMHGRSQAVRLPKEFRFDGSEVRVSKVGDKVILEPIKKQPFDVDAWFARLDELGGRDFLPEGIPDEAPAEPDPRVFFDE
jgi:antitoxin VapB